MKLNQIVKLYFDDTYLEEGGSRSGGMQYEKLVANFFKKKGLETNNEVEIWQPPAGSDAGWPDIGMAIKLDGQVINLHIEAKKNVTDDMGSLRSWIFNGKEFTVDEAKEGEDVRVILSVMNNNKEALKNAKTTLRILKKFFKSPVIRSGVTPFAAFADKQVRLDKAVGFIREIKKKIKGKSDSAGIQIARVKSGEIGSLVVDHYNNKFRARSGKNLLMFTAQNQLWMLPGKKADPKAKKAIEDWLGIDTIPTLPKKGLGILEIRVSLGKTLVAKGSNKGEPRPVEKSNPKFDVFAVLKWTELKKSKGILFMKGKAKPKQEPAADLGTLGVDTSDRENPTQQKPNR
jgi:hypothetical protein